MEHESNSVSDDEGGEDDTGSSEEEEEPSERSRFSSFLKAEGLTRKIEIDFQHELYSQQLFQSHI